MYKMMISVLMVFALSLSAAVDINHATFEELVSLKGIGKKKAHRSELLSSVWRARKDEYR